MTFAEELLELARQIAGLDGDHPRQASLRRALSTAYYALFHLLIGEATANWGQSELRPLLGRVFEHGKMRQACNKVSGGDSEIPRFEKRATPEDHLQAVVRTFILARDYREDADYDVELRLSPKEVETQLESAEHAFRSWMIIRGQPDAQKLLVLLMGPKQRRRPA